MKKIIIFAFIAICTVVMVNSCGTSKNLAVNSYTAEGTGSSSIGQDWAYKKAYINAASKIAEKYGIVIDVNEIQQYSDAENSNGKKSETLDYRQSVTTKSSAELRNVNVDATYSRRRNEYWCTVVLTVSGENIE